MLDDTTRNLGFLLTLSPLLLACPASDDSAGDGTSSDTGNGTGAPATTGQPTPPTTASASASADGSTTGTVDPTTGSADTSTGDPTTGVSVTGSSTDDSTTSSSSGDGSGTTDGMTDGATDGTTDGATDGATTGGMPRLCEAYGDLLAKCLGYDPMVGVGYCEYSIDYYGMQGAACGAAYEEVVACINMLSCMEIDAGGFCEPEIVAFDMACP